MERVFVSSSSHRLMLLIDIAENPETGEILLGGPNFIGPREQKSLLFQKYPSYMGQKQILIFYIMPPNFISEWTLVRKREKMYRLSPAL